MSANSLSIVKLVTTGMRARECMSSSHIDFFLDNENSLGLYIYHYLFLAGY